MVMIVVSVLLSTIYTNYCFVVRGEGIAPEIALTKSVMIDQRTGKHIRLFFCITHIH